MAWEFDPAISRRGSIGASRQRSHARQAIGGAVRGHLTALCCQLARTKGGLARWSARSDCGKVPRITSRTDSRSVDHREFGRGGGDFPLRPGRALYTLPFRSAYDLFDSMETADWSAMAGENIEGSCGDRRRSWI